MSVMLSECMLLTLLPTYQGTPKPQAHGEMAKFPSGPCESIDRVCVKMSTVALLLWMCAENVHCNHHPCPSVDGLKTAPIQRWPLLN